MSRLSEFFFSFNEKLITARFIMPYLVTMRSVMKIHCKLVKIWEPKLANRPIFVHQNSGNNYRDCRVYYQEPGAKVYCVWLNFNISVEIGLMCNWSYATDCMPECVQAEQL